ncbi:putative ABC transporter type 1, transmembrane domain superfamily [Dioscorea sansibarensis]
MEKKLKNENENGNSNISSSSSSFKVVFLHADVVDKWLMAIGTIGVIGDGMSTPITLLVTSLIMNESGAASSSSPSFFIEEIDKNAVALLYIACGLFVAAFLGTN